MLWPLRSCEVAERMPYSERPTLIVAKSYRQRGHYEGDPMVYRSRGRDEGMGTSRSSARVPLTGCSPIRVSESDIVSIEKLVQSGPR